MKHSLIFAIFAILIFGGFFVYKNNERINQSSVIQSVLKTSPPSPTPFPFEELTVPFLRNKEFKSSLGELIKLSSNGNYTSFLTSYTSDGLKINGLLTKPSGEMPSGGWPAIVFIHGYIPPKTYKTLEKYIDHVNFLAKNGFVVFKIDLRGHGTSEGEADGGYYSSDYIIDVLNARSALQSSDFVNPDKIGLWGHSMAGNVVMRSFAAKPEIPAVVIWAGAVYTYKDLAEYGISDNSYQPLPSDSQRQRKRQLLRSLYGDPKDGNPFWNLVAPTNYLQDLKGALSLNHAVNDDVVSIEYSRNLSKFLDDTLVTHQLHEYPSGGHNINGSSFNSAMQDTVDFFKKYLSN